MKVYIIVDGEYNYIIDAFDSREEADRVCENLNKVANFYHVVSVDVKMSKKEANRV